MSNENNNVIKETGLEVRKPLNSPKTLSPARQVMMRFFRSKLSVIGLVILFVLFMFSFFGPLFTPWGETEQDKSGGMGSYLQRPIEFTDDDGVKHIIYDVTFDELTINVKAFPSWEHPLGTDDKGMDVLARLMYGGRISLTIGFVVIFLEIIIGVIMGGLAGYFGKWVDQLIMRIVDIFQCIPTLPIMLITSVLIDAFGVPANQRIYFLMLILTVFGWAGVARLVRGQMLSLREMDFMTAAESLGFSSARKIFKHMLPNVMPQLLVTMTMGLGGIILSESVLSFLGLGIQYPLASWGTMINVATSDTDILANYFHIWVPAGICIVLAVLAFNFIGDGLRDAFDPKGKR